MAASVVRASAVMASGTMVSRILGFAKAILLVAAIGQTQSVSGDAFANGNLLPNTLYILLAGGMLNAVLVPQIVRAAKGPDGGGAYINKVLTLVVTVLTVITALSMIAAPWIVHLFTLTWEDTQQRALATAFAYWCLPQIIFYGLYTVMGEVLNAKSVFGPFTWAPVLANVVGIAGIIVFMAMFGADPNGERSASDWTPLGIAVLAGSATLGIVAQALILFASWRRAGIRFRPDFQWRGVGLAHTGKIAGWSLATIIVMQLGGFITTIVINSATNQGPSTFAMQNAWLVFMLPHSVIAVSLSTAYFTRLSGWGQAGDLVPFRKDFSASTRQISLLMVLAAALVFVTAPFVSRVMQLGSSMELVDQFSIVLQAYTIGLAAYSFLFMVQRAFYALSDTRTPFVFTTIQIVLLVALSLAALAVPKSILGAVYAASWSATTLVQVVIATVLLRRKIGSIRGREIGASVLRFVVAALPALVVGTLLTNLFRSVRPEFGAGYAIAGAVVSALGATAAYAGALWLMRAPEALEIGSSIVQRVLRRR